MKLEKTNSSHPINQAYPFPLEVLPPVLRSFIREANRVEGMTIDHLAAAILGAASMAVGRTHRLELTAGRQYTGQIFLALVGETNIGKSRALELALGPIHRHDALQYEQYKEAWARYQLKQERTRKTGRQPSWNRIMVQDPQPKVLCKINEDNRRGIALCPYHLVGWLSGFGKEKTRSFWESVWSEEPVSMRARRTKATQLQHPYISVVGDLQSEDLAYFDRYLGSATTLRHHLLFVWPETKGIPSWTCEAIPQETKDHYNTGIQRLLELTFADGDQPRLVAADAVSRQLIVDYITQERPATEEGSQEWLQPGVQHIWLTHVARCGLLLQLLWWAFAGIEKNRLTEEMTARAVQLAEYFYQHSRKVFAPSVKVLIDRLPPRKQKLYQQLPSDFSLAEGVLIAYSLGVQKRTLQRFLQESSLFVRVAHGWYEKRK